MASYTAVELVYCEFDGSAAGVDPASSYEFLPATRANFGYVGVELKHCEFADATPKGDGHKIIEEYVWIGPGGQPDNEHAYWG